MPTNGGNSSGRLFDLCSSSSIQCLELRHILQPWHHHHRHQCYPELSGGPDPPIPNLQSVLESHLSSHTAPPENREPTLLLGVSPAHGVTERLDSNPMFLSVDGRHLAADLIIICDASAADHHFRYSLQIQNLQRHSDLKALSELHFQNLQHTML